MCKLYAKINLPSNARQPLLGWMWQVSAQPTAKAVQAGTGEIGVCFDFLLFIENAGSILEKRNLAG